MSKKKISREKTKVLVLTLYSGENEYKDSLEMLKRQTYSNWEQKVFAKLPNKEAHNKLYRYIMKHSNEYDLFVKMDADMVFKDKDSLRKIVQFFAGCTDLDQANFSVLDILSGLEIIGLLVFSNKVTWQTNKERLFVDHTPDRPGIRLIVWGKPAPIALHNPNPNLFQAFHFGAHRALKATQRKRDKKRWIQAALQWHLLMSVWIKYLKSKDRQRAFMLLGAFSVWRKEVDLTANEYGDTSLKKKFEEYKHLDDREILIFLNKKWGKVILFNYLLYLLLWPKIAEYKLRSRIRTWYYFNIHKSFAIRL